MPRPAMRIKPGSNPAAEKFLPPLRNEGSFLGGTDTIDTHEIEFLELEQLVSRSMARFGSLPADQTDREIAALLRQVLDSYRFDRCGLMTLSQDRSEARAVHVAQGEGIASAPDTFTLSNMFPWTGENLLKGDIVCFSSLTELPPRASVDRWHYEAMGVKSFLAIPIYVGGSVEFFIFAHYVAVGQTWRKEIISLLRLIGELFVNALGRCKREAVHHECWEEINRQNAKLQLEAECLQSEIICSQQHEEIIGQSNPLLSMLKLTEQVAPTDSTVLISGETGTGKELTAQAIHKLSRRRNKPMVKVNCASLPASLVESELFGRERGAYTGALTRQAGRFEIADGGTIFLDEIAEMSLELQSKLLRVLQEGQFERLGSTKTIQVDVRVIAATNRNLQEEVRKGTFREDLYYRLNVFHIVVPPLRERFEDIPLLVWAFIDEFAEKMGKKINKVSKQDMTVLQCYPWPGNIRELRNVIEHAVIVSPGDRLQVQLPKNTQEEVPGILTLEEYEIRHIREALRLSGWRIKGEGGAAQLLGLNPSTLYSRMQKLRISNRQVKDEMSP